MPGCLTTSISGAGTAASHLKVFATEDDANAWLEKNDSEGVAFEYEVAVPGWLELSSRGADTPPFGWRPVPRFRNGRARR